MAELFDIVVVCTTCKMLSSRYSVDYDEGIGVWSKRSAEVCTFDASRSLIGNCLVCRGAEYVALSTP
jgi:hypothetical protein